MHRRFVLLLSLICPALLVALLGALLSTATTAASGLPESPTRSLALQPSAAVTQTYTNPLQATIPNDGVVENCADPSLIRGEDEYWYLYCTTDPLNDEDVNEQGDFNFHLIPMLRSSDLVNWTYMGDAFTERPAWAAPTAGLWAPEIQYINGQYYLYYGVTDVTDETSGVPGCDSDNAIGVATSASPLGPWVHHDAPVVEPRQNGDGCNFFWTFDPEVTLADGGQRYLYYGSYYGGIYVRPLSADGFSTDPAAALPITIANRYEGAEVVRHEGFFYLFVSAANCCNGPLTGYSVFVGRSESALGPFVDKEGVSFLQGRVGGTPALSMNGNRWVGPGHNSVFTDFAGQMWTVYHAIDQGEPYFEGAVGFTKRPLLMDPVDWVDGWPTVRGGFWISDEPMPAPAAQPGDAAKYQPIPYIPPNLGTPLLDYSDEFEADTLNPQWSWVREPATDTYGLAAGSFFFQTQGGDLYVDSNSASVLVEDAPDGDYVVETRVHLDLPPEGCCFNYVQAGLVIYGDDDNFVKLSHASIWETRQTEFAKEVSAVPDGYPRYGNTVVGPPGEWTWLRIIKRTRGDEEEYTASTSQDGINWARGGTWTHTLGDTAQIGLISFGGTGFTARFEYVRVYELESVTAVTLDGVDARGSASVAWLAPTLGLLLTGAALAARRRHRGA